MRAIISDHDVKEVVKFQQYLADMSSEMPAEEFAAKYHEYMGCSPELSKRHVELQRARGGQNG